MNVTIDGNSENKNDKMNRYKKLAFLILGISIYSCKAPEISLNQSDMTLADEFYNQLADTTNIAEINWEEYFDDPNLKSLIDSALTHNQELNIVLQELEVRKNEILEKEGEYQPFLNAGAGLGVDKAARYTRDGAVEHELEIKPETEFPEPLGDLAFGLSASWEIDIWKKLRNAKSAAEFRYLASTEGKNFLITQLVAEIAESYYELIALDNLLKIIDTNLQIQSDALYKVRILKENAKANQLVVQRFEAQLLNTQNQQYSIKQKILETENRISYLMGQYPEKIKRNSNLSMDISISEMQAGLPSDLLQNRPDIRQAEYNIQAANLDVVVARANFLPQVDLKAGLGFQAFNPLYLVRPKSLAFNLAGDLIAPLVNKKAIIANYNMANSMQIQSVIQYEQTILNAYTDVLNQLGKLENYSNSYKTKQQEVDILNNSVRIANNLFKYAKADYVEVLLTQEEVLDAQMELVEIRLKQLHSKIQIYRSLGGGWRI